MRASQPLDLAAEGNLAVAAKTDNVENLLADVDANAGQWGGVGVYLELTAASPVGGC